MKYVIHICEIREDHYWLSRKISRIVLFFLHTYIMNFIWKNCLNRCSLLFIRCHIRQYFLLSLVTSIVLYLEIFRTLELYTTSVQSNGLLLRIHSHIYTMHRYKKKDLTCHIYIYIHRMVQDVALYMKKNISRTKDWTTLLLSLCIRLNI